MRILLVECLPRKLKFDLVGHEVATAPEVLAKLETIKPGDLIRIRT